MSSRPHLGNGHGGDGQHANDGVVQADLLRQERDGHVLGEHADQAKQGEEIAQGRQLPFKLAFVE